MARRPKSRTKLEIIIFLGATVVPLYLLDVSVQELSRKIQCCVCKGPQATSK